MRESRKGEGKASRLSVKKKEKGCQEGRRKGKRTVRKKDEGKQAVNKEKGKGCLEGRGKGKKKDEGKQTQAERGKGKQVSKEKE